MYSSQINSRDLFYSNPADRFLGNDAGLKTSLESGFGSSFGYSQNEHTKDLLSGNSEEIFTQTPKTIKEPQIANSDYQKYISQNLLFGKKGRPSKYNFRSKDNTLDSKKLPSPRNKEQELNGINEIKNIVCSLHDSIRQLNADVSEVKDSTKSMEIEIMRQNERIASFEDTFSQQTKIMEANEKQLKKGNKEDNTAKLQKLVSENIKETKQAIDKLKGIAETNQNKILEIIRKNSTTQANANKKTLEEMKKCNELNLRKIMAKIDKIYKEFEENLEHLKNISEENLKIQIESLRKLILSSHSSIKETITSQKINTPKSTFYKRPSVIQTEKHNATPSERFSFVKPLNIPRAPLSNASYRIKEESVFSKAPSYSLTQGSVHTPLAEVMKRNKTPTVISCPRGQPNKFLRLSETQDDRTHQERSTTPSALKYNKQNGKNTFSISESDESVKIVKESVISPYKVNKSSQKYLKTYTTKYNYKQNSAAPKPRQQINLQSNNDFRTALESNVTRNDSKHTKKTIVNNRNLRSMMQFRNNYDTDTNRSSPYLTVYEATRRTEEFGFL